MRKKSKQKQQDILKIAEALFLELGFEAVSMAQISAKVGGSKATLYNYFASKEEIFIEVILNIACSLSTGITQVIDQALPLEKKLTELGIRHLRFITSEPIIKIRRLVITQSHRASIGKEVYNRGPRIGWQRVADFLGKAHQEKLLHLEDPWEAAMHFKGLLEGDLLERSLLGVITHVEARSLQHQVDSAVKIFLSFYSASPVVLDRKQSL